MDSALLTLMENVILMFAERMCMEVIWKDPTAQPFRNAELGRHVSQEHMGRGKDNKATSAVFGVMEAVSVDSYSEEEMNNCMLEMEKVNGKRMRLESSRPMCLLCEESVTTTSSLETHLASYHRELCFLCTQPGCGLKAWLQLEQAVTHTRGSAIHASEEFKLFEHMEEHEHLNREDQARITANTLYGCRTCRTSMSDDLNFDMHMVKQIRGGRWRREEAPDFKSPTQKPRRGSRVSGEFERRFSGERKESEERDRNGSGDLRGRISGERRETSFTEKVRNTISGARERGFSGEFETDKYGCTLCRNQLSVYEHVHDAHRKHDSVFAQYFSLPSDLRVVKCKYCNISWPGEAPLMMKATLRSHREEHYEMLTSVNDCYQLSESSSESQSSPRSKAGPQCSYCIQVMEIKKSLVSHVTAEEQGVVEKLANKSMEQVEMVHADECLRKDTDPCASLYHSWRTGVLERFGAKKVSLRCLKKLLGDRHMELGDLYMELLEESMQVIRAATLLHVREYFDENRMCIEDAFGRHGDMSLYLELLLSLVQALACEWCSVQSSAKMSHVGPSSSNPEAAFTELLFMQILKR